MTTHPTDGPIHTWFGLSYCNYQVLHRTLMQSMPIEWQKRMVACLDELADAYQHIEQPEAFKVDAATEHIVNEMTDTQLKEAGIVEDWYRGETPPEGLDAEDLAEWREQHEDPEGPAYSQDGEELDGHERVMLPAVDPVPHYNRGRTYVEPRLPALSVPVAPATDTQPGEEPDTLPAWLYQRFAVIHGMPAWDRIDDGQRAYWEHQAAAVRRAAARGGFKTAGPASSSG